MEIGTSRLVGLGLLAAGVALYAISRRTMRRGNLYGMLGVIGGWSIVPVGLILLVFPPRIAGWVLVGSGIALSVLALVVTITSQVNNAAGAIFALLLPLVGLGPIIIGAVVLWLS